MEKLKGESSTSTKSLMRVLFQEDDAAYTVEEICEKIGKTPVSVRTSLSDLKNDKYCGAGGKLFLRRRHDGKYIRTDKNENEEKSLPKGMSAIPQTGILEEENFEETSFAYERDLQGFLVKHLSVIEKGLRLYKDPNGNDGIEYSVDAKNKRIDILAIDKHEVPVVIELKVSKGHENVIGQCAYYRNRIKDIFNCQRVRTIIIARTISYELKTAVRDIPDSELFEYKMSIKLEKINGKDS